MVSTFHLKKKEVFLKDPFRNWRETATDNLFPVNARSGQLKISQKDVFVYYFNLTVGRKSNEKKYHELKMLEPWAPIHTSSFHALQFNWKPPDFPFFFLFTLSLSFLNNSSQFTCLPFFLSSSLRFTLSNASYQLARKNGLASDPNHTVSFNRASFLFLCLFVENFDHFYLSELKGAHFLLYASNPRAWEDRF